MVFNELIKKTALFFILVHFCTGVIAQPDFKPGYIIKNNDDTVFGQIDYEGNVFNSKYCSFRENSSNQSFDYLPGQVKAYRFTGGKYYVSRHVTIDSVRREVFLEYLVDGALKLYYLPQEFYFIEKDNQELQILENTEHTFKRYARTYIAPSHQYVGILKIYLHDCPEISDEINNAKLDQSSLIKIAKDYHQQMCPDQECIVYSKTPPKVNLRLGIVSGCNYDMVDIYPISLNVSRRDWSIGPTAGLQLDVHRTGSFERAFMTIGVYYSQMDHAIKFVNPGGYTNRVISFNMKNIYFDLSFNYQYPRFKIKPFVGLGFTQFFVLRKKSKNTVTKKYSEG